VSEKPAINATAATFNDPLIEGDELDVAEPLVWPPPDVDLETFTVVGVGRPSATAERLPVLEDVTPRHAQGALSSPKGSVDAIDDEIVDDDAPEIADAQAEPIIAAENAAWDSAPDPDAPGVEARVLDEPDVKAPESAVQDGPAVENAPWAESTATPAITTRSFPPSTLAPPATTMQAVGPIAAQGQPPVAATRPLRRPARQPNRRTLAAVAGFVTLLATGGGASYAVVRLMQTPVTVPAAGTLTVESQPAAATVAIDGVTRGTTPVRLSLAPGRYQLDVRLGSTTRRRAITIGEAAVVSHFIELSPAAPAVPTTNTRTTATPTAAVPAPVASIAAIPIPKPKPKPADGSLRVPSPIALDIFEGGELIGSADERLTLSPGRHTLTLVNRALNFEAERQVTVASGRQAHVSVDLPDGTLHVNALPWAEVFVDGERHGETPLGSIALRIGSHQVTLRNPEFGERSMSVTVKSGVPTRLSVDLRK
jgi:PEGA domain